MGQYTLLPPGGTFISVGRHSLFKYSSSRKQSYILIVYLSKTTSNHLAICVCWDSFLDRLHNCYDQTGPVTASFHYLDTCRFRHLSHLCSTLCKGKTQRPQQEPTSRRNGLTRRVKTKTRHTNAAGMFGCHGNTAEWRKKINWHAKPCCDKVNINYKSSHTLWLYCR